MANGDDTTTLWLPREVMRERATVHAARELPASLNFVKAHYTRNLASGREHHALVNTRDWQRIVDGYACPDCLLIFDEQRTTCPLCPWERDAIRDFVNEVPPEWQPGPSRTSSEILGSQVPRRTGNAKPSEGRWRTRRRRKRVGNVKESHKTKKRSN